MQLNLNFSKKYTNCLQQPENKLAIKLGTKSEKIPEKMEEPVKQELETANKVGLTETPQTADDVK